MKQNTVSKCGRRTHACTHSHMISDDSAKEQMGKNSLINDLARTRHNMPKDEDRSFLNTIYIYIYKLTQNKFLNIKARLKRQKSYDIRFGNNFLDLTPKTQLTKSKCCTIKTALCHKIPSTK